MKMRWQYPLLLLLLLLLPAVAVAVAVGGYDDLSTHLQLLLLPLAVPAQLPPPPPPLPPSPPPPQAPTPQDTPREQFAIRESSAGTGSAWNRKIEPPPVTSSRLLSSWPTFGDGWSGARGGVAVGLGDGCSREKVDSGGFAIVSNGEHLVYVQG